MDSASQNQIPPYMRVIPSFLLPILVGLIFAGVGERVASSVDNVVIKNGLTVGTPLLLLGIGVTSLFMGVRWYGTAEMGLRGGRPLMSGLSFAFLGWIALLIARFVSVGSDPNNIGSSLGITFLYLLIIQALCVQLWLYGLIFRVFSEWRSPIIATWISGVLFGIVGFYLFGESFPTPLGVLWFVVWGILYGVIRVRTGSILGIVIVQALQTLTVWHILPADPPISTAWLYGISGVLFIIIIWRLVPKYQSDLRV